MTASISRTALTLAEVASLPSQSAGEGAFGVKSDGNPVFRYGSNAEARIMTSAAPYAPQTRLTLSSGNPAPSSPITGATTLYLTPYAGNGIMVPDGSGGWIEFRLNADLSLAIPSVANALYDIFAYNNGGVLALEAVAWTDFSNRSSAISRIEGFLRRTSLDSRLYLGSLGTTSVAGQSESSPTKRLLYNQFNQVSEDIEYTDDTDNWTYSTATWRSWNNNSNAFIDIVQGMSERVVNLTFDGLILSNGTSGVIGINVDTNSGVPTITGSLVAHLSATLVGGASIALLNRKLAAGRRRLYLVEYANGGPVAFYGDGGGTWSRSRASGSVWM